MGICSRCSGRSRGFGAEQINDAKDRSVLPNDFNVDYFVLDDIEYTDLLKLNAPICTNGTEATKRFLDKMNKGTSK